MLGGTAVGLMSVLLYMSSCLQPDWHVLEWPLHTRDPVQAAHTARSVCVLGKDNAMIAAAMLLTDYSAPICHNEPGILQHSCRSCLRLNILNGGSEALFTVCIAESQSAGSVERCFGHGNSMAV